MQELTNQWTLLNKVYTGELVVVKENPILLELINDIVTRLEEAFLPEDTLENIHDYRDNDRLYTALQVSRAQILKDPSLRLKLLSYLESLSLDPNYFLFDIPRLRMVSPRTHTIAAAKAAFGAHRDTWYANPNSQVNIWFPLYTVCKEQVFALYPDYFERAILNDSASFNYEEFSSSGGFQSTSPESAVFPSALEAVDSTMPRRVPLKRGESLLFSATQLHQTQANTSNNTRFSIDFRIALKHEYNTTIALPLDCDNESQGDASQDYKDVTTFLRT